MMEAACVVIDQYNLKRLTPVILKKILKKFNELS